MAYFLSPQSLIVMKEIRRTMKRQGRRAYSDITNKQLADRCGVSEQTINTTMNRLEGKSYIQRWTYHETETVKRRRLYLRNMKMKRDGKLKNRSFREVLKEEFFPSAARVEWSRIATSDWLSWIPIPNTIKNGKDLKVYSILIGQHLRGKRKIKLSDRQIAAISRMDRDVVAASMERLAESGFILVTKNNRRDRTIEFM